MTVPRRRRKARVLLVPDQWSGSVQEYYHFILGYLAPLVLWVDRHPGRDVAVRDCGPMNPWLDQVPGNPDISILTPGDMLHLFAGKYHRSAVLRGLDDPASFRARDLSRFRRLMLTAHGIPVGPAESLTVVDRLSSGAFNATAAAEVPASGAAVRSTPNLTEVVSAHHWDHPLTIVDAAELSPEAQLRLFASTRVLVAQHGAGLTNMVWMPPGGEVVEILSPQPAWVTPIFANLASACGHRHRVVHQSDDHAPVDPTELIFAVEAAAG